MFRRAHYRAASALHCAGTREVILARGFGEHAFDEEGNYIGSIDYTEFTPDNESQAAWADLAEGLASPAAGEGGGDDGGGDEAGLPPAGRAAPTRRTCRVW